jgi:hypothetical protein
MNEYVANHWTAQEVRDSGRDLRSKLPANFLLSLSSPDTAHGYTADGQQPTNEDQQAGFDELYGGDGAGANEITIHTMRDGQKWSDPYSYNYLYPSWPKINNEPPGPGSSAGGMDTTGEDVRKDLSNTIGAGWGMYVGHSEWSVWNGHLPVEYYNGWRELKFLKDLPNMPECAAVMKELAGTGGGDDTRPGAPQYPDTVSLQSAHGPLLTAELDYSVTATRAAPDPGPWEIWLFEAQPSAFSVALKSHHGGYLCADQGGGGAVLANRLYDTPGPWETFTAVPTEVDGRRGYALRCHDEVHYLTAALDGSIVAQATTIGPWEVWVFAPDPEPWRA